MKVIILCGGSGTRLWPISRKSTPKQFSKIFNDKSLFQLTIERNTKLADSFIIVVNRDQYLLCQEQWEELKISHKVEFILEPVGRNTAPAIALASFLSSPNETLLIIPSDHLIGNLSVYHDCVESAQELAKKENLVTFGIKAKYPETGYGYIEADGINVKSFKEKPNLTTAIKYISHGNYFWNSGMFCFTAKSYLEALKNHAPLIYQKSEHAFKNRSQDENIYKIDESLMLAIPDQSIDYAVMENSTNTKVIPSPFDWNDLGSFDSLYEELPKDDLGNTLNANFIGVNSTNNLIIGPSKKLITTFDINDLIIVDTQDALLIGKKGKSQKVKTLVEKLKALKSKLLN